MAAFNIHSETIYTYPPSIKEELCAIYTHIPLNDEELYARYGTAVRLRSAFEELYKLLLRYIDLKSVVENKEPFTPSSSFIASCAIPENSFQRYHTESALLVALYRFCSVVTQIFSVNRQSFYDNKKQFRCMILKLRYFVEQPETNRQLIGHMVSRIIGASTGFSNLFISDDKNPPQTLYVLLAFLFVCLLEFLSEIVADHAKHNYDISIYLQDLWNSLKISFNLYVITFCSSFMKTGISCTVILFLIVIIKYAHTYYTRRLYFVTGPKEPEDVINLALYILQYKSINQQQYALLNDIYILVQAQNLSVTHLDQSILREKLKKINASTSVENPISNTDIDDLILNFIDLKYNNSSGPNPNQA